MYFSFCGVFKFMNISPPSIPNICSHPEQFSCLSIFKNVSPAGFHFSNRAQLDMIIKDFMVGSYYL
jgi:hypothetical protein